MLQDSLLILILAYTTYCGALCARHTLHISGKAMATALGLPLGLSALTLMTTALHTFLPLESSVVISLVLLRLANLNHDLHHYVKHSEEEHPPEDKLEPFGRISIAALLTAAILSYFALHMGQLSELSSGFLGTYPFTRALLKGPITFEAPFFPSQPYTGSLYRSLLIAMISPAVNYEVIRTEWLLQAILLLDGFVLWSLALRLYLRRALPSAIATFLLFWMQVVPSSLSAQAPAGSTILDSVVIGALVTVLTTLIRQCKHHWLPTPSACTCLGALFFFSWLISPILALSLFLAFWLLVSIYCYKRRFLATMLLRCATMVTISTLLWGSTQIPVWQHFLQLHSHHLLQVHIPSHHFLQIAVTSGAFSDSKPQYVSIFSLTSLRQHTLSFWFSPLLLVWAIRRKSAKGILIWSFGALLFLLPGLIECQVRGVLSQWLWKAVADGAFAVLLGYALGDLYQLWSRHRSPRLAHLQRLSLLLAILLCVSPLVLQLYKRWEQFPLCPNRLQYLYNPLYPATAQWLSDVPQIALNEEETELSDWLWRTLDSPQRAFFAPTNLNSYTIEHLALLSGQAGCIPVGSQVNLLVENLPREVRMPSPGALSFLHSHQSDALLGLGTEIIVSDQFLSKNSDAPYSLKLLRQFVSSSPQAPSLAVYRIIGSFPWSTPIIPCPNPGTEITLNGLPSPSHSAGGQAYDISLHSSRPLNGWLRPVWHDAQGRWQDKDLPLCTFIKGSDAKLSLVYPYRDGSYSLSWLYYPLSSLSPADPSQPLSVERLAGSTAIEHQFSATLEKSLRLVTINKLSPQSGTVTLANVSAEDLDFGTDLRLEWRIWSDRLHSYTTQKAKVTNLPLPLAAGASCEIPWQSERLLAPYERLDFRVGAPYGYAYSITRQ